MPQYIKPVPVNDARGAKRFEAWLNKLAGNIIEKKKEIIRQEIRNILVDILDNNPVYTGASKGVPGAPHAYRLRYRSHPAFGMKVGNALNGGETGWQIEETETKDGLKIALVNPMWRHYLRAVEYGIAGHSHGFVRKAWLKHLGRRRRMR